jgi:mRNA-degrading endonuclease RelE of RelBE toxin-antitoxin system
MSKDFWKYVQKLPVKQRILFEKIIECIEKLELDGFDIKKIQGKRNQFRLRSGKWRVVFIKRDSFGEILKIDSRGNIYK